MQQTLARPEFAYVTPQNKAFLTAFNAEMERLGYTANGQIGPGHCWGRHMAVYTKTGLKSKKSYARVYLRDEDLVLRLYLSGVDRHRAAVEQAPAFIREAFTGPFAACGHCHGKTDCVHQKRYTLGGAAYEICDGRAFWFFSPEAGDLPAYLNLFTTFYPPKAPA